MHYNYFRDYDPGVGKYMTSVPIGLKGGLSTFGYVGGEPNLQVDFKGLNKEDSIKISNEINRCVADLTAKKLRYNSFFNNRIDGALDCGEQTEKIIICLQTLKLTDNWSFVQRAGFGHS